MTQEEEEEEEGENVLSITYGFAVGNNDLLLRSEEMCGALHCSAARLSRDDKARSDRKKSDKH